MTDNLRHWDALWRTDPKHTKGFQRAGGFKGTAIKPIYLTHKMTEHFGPCGMGWGTDKPDFTTMTAADETLVYCTVALWYRDGNDRAVVYGVGGDKAVAKNKNGVFTDDEAFKKAYTDALSNAMKLLGVSADVHMGLFEDAKYVSELRKEFAEDDVPHQQQTEAKPDPLKAEVSMLAKKIKEAPTIQALALLMDDSRALLQKVPKVTYDHVGGLYQARVNQLDRAPVLVP